METVAYTVHVTFEDPNTAQDWVRWLCDGHIVDVLAGGAADAEIIALDGGREYEVRYHFPSRGVFAVYEREHAPRLRAEASQLFPPERGVVYRRTLGTVVFRLS
jgi:hypothetical protein